LPARLPCFMMEEAKGVQSVGEEVKKPESVAVSPWELVVWKLDQVEKEFHKVADRVELVGERIDRVREEMRRELSALREDVRREVAEVREGLRREVTGVREEVAGVRDEFRREVTGIREEVSEARREIANTRQSFTVLELTAVLGFLAVLISIWLK